MGNNIKFICLVAAAYFSFKAAGSTETATHVISTTPALVEGKQSESDKINWDLRAAVDKNDPAEARRAISRGADLERKSWGGMTPLHWAVDTGHVEVMDELLKAGADVEAVSYNGNRPLHIAALWRRDEAVRKLVKAGANIHAAGKEGKTPLQLAVHMHHNSTAALLRSLGALN